MEYAPTSHNKRYTQIALIGQFGLHKTPVGRALSARTPFVGFCSATFFCARKNTSYFSSSGTKNVVYLERYAKYNFKLVGKIYENY